MADALITTRAAAALLGVGTTSIKRWADDGTLACVRTAGGHRRFLRGDVLRLLQDGQGSDLPVRPSSPPTHPLARARLPHLGPEELDRLPFGVIELSDDGLVLQYNAAEERFAGLDREAVLGRQFFADVAPCTNNRLLRGRFLDGVAAGDLDVRVDYTFTYKMAARLVELHLLRDPVSGTNWLLVTPR